MTINHRAASNLTPVTASQRVANKVKNRILVSGRPPNAVTNPVQATESSRASEATDTTDRDQVPAIRTNAPAEAPPMRFVKRSAQPSAPNRTHVRPSSG